MQTYSYLSLRGRSDITMLMLGIFILMIALIVVMKLNQNSSLLSMNDVDIQNSLRTHAIVGFLYYVNFIAIAVTFLMWLHRASSNLRYLGVTKQRFTPALGSSGGLYL